MLSDILQGLTSLVEQIVLTFGAPGITLIALFENLFPPTPSETLYPLAGKLAYDGVIPLWSVIAAGALGSLAGSLMFYTFGYRLGEQRSRAIIARYGRFRLLRMTITIASVEDYERGLALFQRYGGRIVFAAKLLPLVHGVVSIPAGVVRMNLLAFIVYTVLGSAMWIAVFTLFGYWLGSNWRQVLDWLDIYESLVYIALALLLVYYLARRLRRMRAKASVVSE
jgi:membrane protein DedA with SNARE-associated domain